MISRIRDWIYAIKICRKYGIIWNPFKNHSNAQHKFIYWHDDYKRYKSVIRISPFYPGFIDSFIHEVGHHIYNSNLYNNSRNYQEYESHSESFKLKEEYLCWRFAKLVLRKKFYKDRARGMFKTYFPSEAKRYGSLETVDKYAKYDYNLSK